MAKKKGNKAPSNGSAAAKRSQSIKTSAASASPNGGPRAGKAQAERSYSIPDWRLEHPEFHVEQVREAGEVRYKVFGPLDAPVPPIRESRYLTHEKSIELYRWMLLNRRMEQVLGWRLFRPRPGSLLVRLSAGAAGWRLVCADDPQSGRAAGSRLPSSRRHDAIHGEVRFAHAW